MMNPVGRVEMAHKIGRIWTNGFAGLDTKLKIKIMGIEEMGF